MKLKLAQIALTLILVLGQGCKHEQKSNPSLTPTKTIDFSKTVVARIPQNSLGFYYSNLTTKAYQKYQATAYANLNAKSQGSLISMFNTKDSNSSAYVKLMELFSKNNPLTEIVGYIDQNTNTKQLYFGGIALFKEDSILNNFIEDLKKADPNMSTATFSQGTGYNLKIQIEKEKNPFGITDFYLFAKDKYLYFATAQEKVEEVLTNSNQALPLVLSNKYFKDSVGKLPTEEENMVLGFVDAERFLDVISILPSFQKDKHGLMLEALRKQFAALLFSYSYTDNLVWQMKLLTKEGAQPSEFIQEDSNSEIGELLNFVPESPMIFISLNGKLLKSFKDSALKNIDTDQAKIQEELVLLDNINRLGLVLNPASSGPTMFPVPEILLLLETKDTKGLEESIQKSSSSSVKNSQIPISPWTEKKIDNLSVKTLASPFGLGIYMTSLSDKIVAVTSTESQLALLIANRKNKKTLFDPLLDQNKDAKDIFYTDKNVFSFYLNYPKVADLLSSLEGMMKMYAPQQEGKANNQNLQQEYIANLKTLGITVAKATVSKEAIDVKSTIIFSPAGK